MKRIAAVLLALGTGAGCTAPDRIVASPEEVVIAGVSLTRVPGAPLVNSGITRSARAVIETDAVWRKAWAHLYRGRSPVPPVPEVDFRREVVVIAAMGGRGTGGYGIEVTAAERIGGGTVLHVVETSPGPRCLVTMAATQPVDVVKVPRTALPLRFSEQQVTSDC